MVHKEINTLYLAIAHIGVTALSAVAFLEKHHSLFSALAAILAIFWWLYSFYKSVKNNSISTVLFHTKVVNNVDPQKNPITTYLGALMIILSIGMFILPMIYTVKEDLPTYVPLSIGTIGLSLLLIPDDLKKALKRFLNKKANE